MPMITKKKEPSTNRLTDLSYVGKFAGLVSALDGIPFVDPSVGVIIFAAASLLKDTANRIGDLLDNGKPNKSFKS